MRLEAEQALTILCLVGFLTVTAVSLRSWNRADAADRVTVLAALGYGVLGVVFYAIVAAGRQGDYGVLGSQILRLHSILAFLVCVLAVWARGRKTR